MRYAIVSDIHANLRAWEAVYDDITKQGVDDIICLGDIVGYGPLPAETLESVYERVENIVLGNHDAVIAGKFDPSEFNDNARAIIEWTSEQMTEVAAEVFAEMPIELEGEDFLVSHAEVLDPERFNYIENSEEARESFEACESQIVFVGHTHEPAVFLMDHEKDRIIAAEPFDVKLRDNYRYIVNVGSVGDPRDNDIRSCYCIYDSDIRQVFYRRVEFDIDAYREDLEESGLMIKPDFLKRYDGEEGEDTAIQDWVVRGPARPQIVRTRPKRVIRVSYGTVTSEEEAQAEAEREEKERKKKLLREAAEKKKELLDAQQAIRREREEKAQKQREAMHQKMQRLQRASARRAEEERRRKEQEEQEKLARKSEAAIKMQEAQRKAIEQRKKRKEEQRRKAAEQMKRAKEIAAKRAEEKKKQEKEDAERRKAEEKKRAEEEAAKAARKAERARKIKEAQEARARELEEQRLKQKQQIHKQMQQGNRESGKKTESAAEPPSSSGKGNETVQTADNKKPKSPTSRPSVKKKAPTASWSKTGVGATSASKRPKKKPPQQSGSQSDEARELADLRRRLEQQKAKQKEKKARREKRRQSVLGSFQKIKNKVSGSEGDDDSGS